VLVSDIPANLETCEKWGYTFKNKNIDDLKGKLTKLLNDEELVKKDEQKRIEYAKRNFSWDKTANDLERIFEKCLDQKIRLKGGKL
jgi:glycosyltransferase involved in cell wall biosynthesis